MQQQEEQQETAELEEPHAAEESQPSVVLPPRSSAPPPPALHAAAFHGIAGFLVRALAPHTEADPAAVLLSSWPPSATSSVPARTAASGSTRHGLNLFVILVGESSKARKGTSCATSLASSPKPTLPGLPAA